MSLYEDIEDVKIDTKLGLITWTKHFGLTNEAKPKQKKFYMKQGDTEKEADKKVNLDKRLEESFRIKAYQISEQTIWIDDLTGKVLDPPKKMPEHNLIFTGGSSLFYMYIPESSGHAILIAPAGQADSSWVEMRFGTCRKLK